MKMLLHICSAWLLVSCPSWASDQNARFLEIMDGGGRRIFDLNAVEIIEPGRFSVIERKIDDPDRMRMRLKILIALRRYCERPDGQYSAPTDFLTLGIPIIPVKKVEVKAGVVSWAYPYRQLGPTAASVHCKSFDPTRSEIDLFLEDMVTVTDGLPSKVVYDCNQGRWGVVPNTADDPANAQTRNVEKGTQAFANYLSICRAVTREQPYVPE